MPSVTEIFITLFFITFFVAILAFLAYSYMLILLLKNHSERFNPKGPIEFLKFNWTLLMYYISRSFVGFFGYNKFKDFSFYMDKDQPIKVAESEQHRLKQVYSFFSGMYISFVVFFILTVITLLYAIADSFM